MISLVGRAGRICTDSPAYLSVWLILDDSAAQCWCGVPAVRAHTDRSVQLPPVASTVRVCRTSGEQVSPQPYMFISCSHSLSLPHSVSFLLFFGSKLPETVWLIIFQWFTVTLTFKKLTKPSLVTRISVFCSFFHNLELFSRDDFLQSLWHFSCI